MAYYAAFWLFPLCLVLISILGFMLRFSQDAGNAQGVLLQQVHQQAGPWLADQLQALLAGVKENAGLSGPLGAVTLLAAAIVVFFELDYIFGRILATPAATQAQSGGGWATSAPSSTIDSWPFSCSWPSARCYWSYS